MSKSADPEFLIAPVDMTLAERPGASQGPQCDAPKGLNPFQGFGELRRVQPQVAIVKRAGLARRGGAEFAAIGTAFAAEGRAGLARCQALLGMTPRGGATRCLNRRMMRGRALEAILGTGLFNARLAERYSWANCALPPGELDGFIAALPDGVIAATKATAPPADYADGFCRKGEAWVSLVIKPAIGRLVTDGLRVGVQTRDGERDPEHLVRRAAVAAA